MSQVSCIIPYYNGGDTIVRAIDSVIDSVYCLEVIIVVDASPQPLEPHLTERHLAHIKTGKLRVIALVSNHGQASARNIGASVALGAYLSFLDQDDMYLQGFYDVTVTHLCDNPKLGAVTVGAEFYQDDKIVLDESDKRYVAEITSVPWNVVLRRNVFWLSGAFPVSAQFRTEVAGEDAVFKVLLNDLFSVAQTSSKFVRHYIREGSATDRYLKRSKVVDGEIVLTQLYDNEKNGDLTAAFDRQIKSTWEALKAFNAVSQRKEF